MFQRERDEFWFFFALEPCFGIGGYYAFFCPLAQRAESKLAGIGADSDFAGVDMPEECCGCMAGTVQKCSVSLLFGVQ